MELIIGNQHVTPSAIHMIEGGVEAELRGDALRSLLDATYHGRCTIEVLGGELHRRPLEVVDIAMSGATTRVRLRCSGPAYRLV